MNTQEQRPMSFREKMDLACGLTSLPALSVIVFIRRRIGYRLLDNGWYLLVALAVFLIGVFNYDPRRPLPRAMEWYALAIVVFGAWHRAAAWVQFRRGAAPHSFSSGVSRFEGKRTPRFLRDHRLVNRLIDPLVVAGLGLFVGAHLSGPLGAWLVLSAASLLFYEQLIHHKAIERDMDIADGLIAARVQSDVVKRFDRDGAANVEAEETSPVIPTGLGRDIRAAQSRKRSTAK